MIEEKKRFWELDFLRGICVILMVLDHFLFVIMYTMPQIGKMLGTSLWDGASKWLENNYWWSTFRISIRFPVLFIFFLICGISCTLSHSNAKRGLLLGIVACAITFITVIVERVFGVMTSIYFGVLHMLSVAILLYALFDFLGGLIKKSGKTEEQKRAKKLVGELLAPSVGLIIFIVFFACLYGGIYGDIFNSNVVIEDKTASTLASLFVYIAPNVGGGTIGGTDYWPLLPWAAIVLIGGFIGRFVYNNERAKNFLMPLDGKWNKPVCFVGRHALIIYVFHQVLVIILLSVVTLFALI